METVWVRTSQRQYPVYIGRRLLGKVGAWLQEVQGGRRILVVSHPSLLERYGPPLLQGLREAGFEAQVALVRPGERSKTLGQARRLYQEALRGGLDRRSTVVALGGGVVGDLAGFVAATYMRGIPWVPIPTTLLAQVDASVGGKVGVNLPQGKNLVGAFHQPLFVVADVGTLASLPMREIRCGFAEVLKHGLILDADLFEAMARAVRDRGQEGLPLAPGRHLAWEAVEQAVLRSCQLKGWVVEQDEREESGLRALLNFGHTVGHALEQLMGYRRLRHGEAVAVGMVAESLLSHRLLGLPQEEVAEVVAVLRRAGLPTAWPPVAPEAVWEAMQRDKKFVGGRARFALLRRIGRGEVVEVEEGEVRSALQAHQRGRMG